MTFTEVSLMITAVTGLLTVLISVWNTFIIKSVQHQSNSMKDELVAEVRKSAFMNGQDSKDG